MEEVKKVCLFEKNTGVPDLPPPPKKKKSYVTSITFPFTNYFSENVQKMPLKKKESKLLFKNHN